jgi:hypothetical protein
MIIWRRHQRIRRMIEAGDPRRVNLMVVGGNRFTWFWCAYFGNAPIYAGKALSLSEAAREAEAAVARLSACSKRRRQCHPQAEEKC